MAACRSVALIACSALVQGYPRPPPHPPDYYSITSARDITLAPSDIFISTVSPPSPANTPLSSPHDVHHETEWSRCTKPSLREMSTQTGAGHFSTPDLRGLRINKRDSTSLQCCRYALGTLSDVAPDSECSPAQVGCTVTTLPSLPLPPTPPHPSPRFCICTRDRTNPCSRRPASTCTRRLANLLLLQLVAS